MGLITPSGDDQALKKASSVTFAGLTLTGFAGVMIATAGVVSATTALPDGTTGTTQTQGDNSTKIATTAYVDSAIGGENTWNRVTGGTNYLEPANAGDHIGADAARITKVWATDAEFTNMPTVGGTSINANAVLDLASGEVTQLANIGATTISADQWGYLGATTDTIVVDSDSRLTDSRTCDNSFDNASTARDNLDVYSKTEVDAAITTSYNRRKAVISIATSTSAPPTEVSGDRYILSSDGAPDAGWDGASQGDIVEFNGTTWDATSPVEGYIAYVDDVNKDALYTDDGTPDWELRDLAITNHNDLNNPDGGTSGEYFHLTSAQHTDVAAMVTAGLANLTSGEVTQLANIGATTISADQWGYLGATTDTIVVDSDSRLTDSRTCNNNFDNAGTSRTNLDVYSKSEVDSLVSGGLTDVEVTGTSQAMAVNTSYIANNASLVTLTLPSTATKGDIIEVWGKGAGKFKVVPQNASQTLNYLDVGITTTVGEHLTSVSQFGALRIKCITDDNDFVVMATGGFSHEDI